LVYFIGVICRNLSAASAAPLLRGEARFLVSPFGRDVSFADREGGVAYFIPNSDLKNAPIEPKSETIGLGFLGISETSSPHRISVFAISLPSR